MNIILIGFKATGKTTYGKALAKKTNLKFIDIDDIIVDLNKSKANPEKNCREIYKQKGKKFFRALETEAINELEKIKNSVIATGGGIFENKNNKELIKKYGKIILLNDDKDSVYKRIEKRGFPPFFDKENPRKSFEELFEKRQKDYLEIADNTIECTNKKPEEIIEELVTISKQRNKI
jgi:shikimate kinase